LGYPGSLGNGILGPVAFGSIMWGIALCVSAAVAVQQPSLVTGALLGLTVGAFTATLLLLGRRA